MTGWFQVLPSRAGNRATSSQAAGAARDEGHRAIDGLDQEEGLVGQEKDLAVAVGGGGPQARAGGEVKAAEAGIIEAEERRGEGDAIVEVGTEITGRPEGFDFPLAVLAGDVEAAGALFGPGAAPDEEVGVAEDHGLDDAADLRGPLVIPQDGAEGGVEGLDAELADHEDLFDAGEDGAVGGAVGVTGVAGGPDEFAGLGVEGGGATAVFCRRRTR